MIIKFLVCNFHKIAILASLSSCCDIFVILVFLEWALSNPNSSEINKCGLGKIFEEMFERTTDMFKKAAYTQQCD